MVYVPYRSVSKERQEEFKREVGERAAQRRADGMTVFAEDEAAVQRSQNPAYGWRPTGGRGFTFVGPTVCYAFMQTVGMANDHLLHCFRRDRV